MCETTKDLSGRNLNGYNVKELIACGIKPFKNKNSISIRKHSYGNIYTTECMECKAISMVSQDTILKSKKKTKLSCKKCMWLNFAKNKKLKRCTILDRAKESDLADLASKSNQYYLVRGTCGHETVLSMGSIDYYEKFPDKVYPCCKEDSKKLKKLSKIKDSKCGRYKKIFLTNKKDTEIKDIKVIKRTALETELIPGKKIKNYTVLEFDILQAGLLIEERMVKVQCECGEIYDLSIASFKQRLLETLGSCKNCSPVSARKGKSFIGAMLGSQRILEVVKEERDTRSALNTKIWVKVYCTKCYISEVKILPFGNKLTKAKSCGYCVDKKLKEEETI